MDFETIKGMIAEQLKVNPADIKPESRLIEDLKADSANIMVMIMDHRGRRPDHEAAYGGRCGELRGQGEGITNRQSHV